MNEIERIQKTIEKARTELGYSPLKVLVAPSVFAALPNKEQFMMSDGELIPIGHHWSEAGKEKAIVCLGKNPSITIT